jgi:hypothetical protein
MNPEYLLGRNMQSESMAYPEYGTKALVSLESTLIKEEKKPCECCWKGRKVIKKYSCCLRNLGLLAFCALPTTFTGYMIQGAWKQYMANQDIGLQAIFTFIFGCLTVGCYVATIWTCCRDYRSAPPEEDEVLLDD